MFHGGFSDEFEPGHDGYDYDYDFDFHGDEDFDEIDHLGNIHINNSRNFVRIGDHFGYGGSRHRRRRGRPDHGFWPRMSSPGPGPRPGPGPGALPGFGRRWRHRDPLGAFDGESFDDDRHWRPRPGQSSRLAVRLPEGGGCQVFRRNIMRHLPRARLYMNEDLLDVERWVHEYSAVYPDSFLNWNFLADGLTVAADVLFRNFDECAREGFQWLFDTQRYRMNHARGPVQLVFLDALEQVHAVSCICDQFFGLGCSEPLGTAVMEVAAIIAANLQPFTERAPWQMLFGAVCSVLADECPRQAQMLAFVWRRVPEDLRDEMGGEMAMSLHPGAIRVRRALHWATNANM